MTRATDSGLDARHMRTVVWVVALATVGLVFDGYDLVVYGAVVSTFLRDPSQIGNVTPAIAGMLGSYALVGVLVGALLAGSVGDILGRRKVMLFSYAWFSVGMALTAMTHTTTTFGWMRFFTGLGVGALVATTGALVSEYAPAAKKTARWPPPARQTGSAPSRSSPVVLRSVRRRSFCSRWGSRWRPCWPSWPSSDWEPAAPRR